MTSGLMGDDEDLLTEEEVAALLQVPVLVMRRLHLEGAGPPCVRIGRQTRYRQAIVQRWLAGDGQSSSPVENRWQLRPPAPKARSGRIVTCESRETAKAAPL